MKPLCPDKKNPLVREGTTQKDRFPEALEPSYAPIDARTEKELAVYAHKYAGLLNYFDQKNVKSGDWQLFLEALKKHVTGEEVIPNGLVPPHLALYLSFLRLFNSNQKQLNGITAKHLDAFYKDILGFLPNPAEADRVHVLFDLAKNISPVLLEQGTMLNAGKDVNKKELIYELEEDIIVNKASVEFLRSIFINPSGKAVHYATVANSADGQGKPLDETIQSWDTFGNSSLTKAEVGFALGSPILWLQEGVRKINTRILLKTGSGLSIPASALQNSLMIYLSGEKKWIGPLTVTPVLSSKDPGKTELAFDISLAEDEDPVVTYNSAIHGGQIESLYPVMKVILNNSSSVHLNNYLQGIQVESIKLSVDVGGITALTVENDMGVVDASKPFLPFGTEPVKGSAWSIGYEEAFTKNLGNFKVHVEWMDVPANNMVNYYSSSYSGTDAWLNYSPGSNAFKAKLIYRKSGGDISTKTVDLFEEGSNKSPTTYQLEDPVQGFFIMPNVFYQSVVKKSNLVKSAGLNMKLGYQNLIQLQIYPAIFNVFATAKPTLKSGYIKLELLSNFLHKSYREKYTQAVIQYSKSGTGNMNLPKEAYTPKVKSISLDYTASTSDVDPGLNGESDYLSKEVELFHLGAFGQREIHGYLYSKNDFVEQTKVNLLPEFSSKGEFYIGIKDLEGGQGISILFQVAEGSANPEKDVEEIHWSLLTDNQWMELNDTQVISDNTKGLLQSGIIKFIIPVGISSSNTWMEGGYIWLRASINENVDAVCRFIGVHPQACQAVLKDTETHIEHLQAPLSEGTISKLRETNASIKKVKQPYASYGGYSSEESAEYYRRVSERLRHKNRAITIFDYERIILQAFPSIHKVKCLNHTSATSEHSPGHVTLVLVPDLTNQNAVNKLEPKVSKAILTTVKEFVDDLNPNFVEIHTMNPIYEKVKASFKVAFKKNFEFGFYKSMLNQEILDFLSPWVSGKSSEIYFGGTLHKSVVLKFIEDREYVDFVSEIKLFQTRGKETAWIEVEQAVASRSTAILVSTHEHEIVKFEN